MNKRRNLYKNLRVVAIVFVAIVAIAVAVRAFVIPAIENMQIQKAAEEKAENAGQYKPHTDHVFGFYLIPDGTVYQLPYRI